MFMLKKILNTPYILIKLIVSPFHYFFLLGYLYKSMKKISWFEHQKIMEFAA